MVSKCFYCRRPFAEDTVVNSKSTFELTPKDVAALLEMKEYSFTVEKKPYVGLLNQKVSNTAGREFNDLLPSAKKFYNSSSNDNLWGMVSPVEQGVSWRRWNSQSVMWRTMTDRSANINDVIWLVQLAYDNNIHVSAIFLHKNSFVWVVIGRPHNQSDSNAQAVRKAVKEDIIEGLKSVSLKKENFEMINVALADMGKAVVHKYPTPSMRMGVAAANPRYTITLLATGFVMAFLGILKMYALHNVNVTTPVAANLWEQAKETDMNNAFSSVASHADVSSGMIDTAQDFIQGAYTYDKRYGTNVESDAALLDHLWAGLPAVENSDVLVDKEPIFEVDVDDY